MRTRGAWFLLVLAVACEHREPTAPQGVARVTITGPRNDSAHIGQTRQYSAVATTASGASLASVIIWRTSNMGAAYVDEHGLVTMIARGSAWISASVDGVTDSVRVETLAPVALLRLQPEAPTVITGVAFTIPVRMFDRDGVPIEGRLVHWRADSSVFGSDSTRLTGRRAGSAWVVGESEGASDSVLLTVARPPASVVIIAPADTIDYGDTLALAALVTDSSGAAIHGLPVHWSSSDSNRLRVDAQGRLVAGDLGSGTVTAIAGSMAGHRDFASATRFTGTAVGNGYACGINARGAVYCWGNNLLGHLGVPGATTTWLPVLTGSGFRRLGQSLADASCAADTLDRGWCWGRNSQFQLGGASGSTCTDPGSFPLAACGLKPQVVKGPPALRAIEAGGRLTCGLTPSGSPWCWGVGVLLGTRRTQNTITSGPVAVDGNLLLQSVSVGANHACGLDAGGGAWCWGGDGPLGRSDSTRLLVPPQPVQGGLAFRSLSARFDVTCGVSMTWALYCWGALTPGVITAAPALMAPAVHFRQAAWPCALDSAGIAWCFAGSTTPTAVPGPSFASLATNGTSRACGIDTAGIAWCWDVKASGMVLERVEGQR